MATRNLKKVLRKIYLNAQETDANYRTFNPMDYPKNWNRSVKYLEAQDYRLRFNTIFRPLYKQILAEDIKAYRDRGHSIPHQLKKGLKQNAKEKAREITKAQLAPAAAPEQDYKESQGLLPEG